MSELAIAGFAALPLELRDGAQDVYLELSSRIVRVDPLGQGRRLGRARVRPALIDAPGGTVRAAAKAWGISKPTAARWIGRGLAGKILSA